MKRIFVLFIASTLLLGGCGTGETVRPAVTSGATSTASTATVSTSAMSTAAEVPENGKVTTQAITQTVLSTASTTSGMETAPTSITTTTITSLRTTKEATTNVVSTTVTTTTETKATTKATTGTTTSTTIVPEQPAKPRYEWQSHPQDFKLIAFGFDDLPCSTANVMLVVETLAKYEGFGTCFVLGENIEKSGTSLLEYVVENGFELGNHSYNHPNMREFSYEEVASQLQKTNTLLKNHMGITPKWFRPPYLASNTTIQAASATVDGMSVVGGNKKSQTNAWYNVEDGGDVLRDAVQNAYDGAIYVMHPARSTTAVALDEICKALYNQGYRFCTMSQLFEYKGIKPQYGKTYTDVYG